MFESIAAALKGRKNIGVAVSGGADSVFLLTALHELNAVCVVLHANHKLRDEESDADEAFVNALAASLNLPCYSATLPPADGNLEQEARRARYAFFAECIEKGICDSVATGHTLDDQAETVLYRFLRGSGTAGLSGIRPESQNGIFRPLLGLRRDEIRAWLSERGIAWREDSSNASLTYDRNRLRMKILPELKLFNPAVSGILASTAEWAQDEEDFWRTELDRLAPLYLVTAPETVFLAIRPFLALPVAIQRRLLRRAIFHVRNHLRSIDFQHIEAIRNLMAGPDGSGRIQIPDLDIYRSFDQLRIAPQGFDARIERNFETPLAVPGRTDLPDRKLTIDIELAPPPAVYNSDLNDLDRLKAGGPLLLRNWRPGDQLNQGEKIKTLFQEHRIPLWERRSWPVITRFDTSGGEAIIWTRLFGAAKEFQATPESVSILRVCDSGRGNGIKSAGRNV